MAREKTKCMTSIGGQGIMMRGPQKTAVAVRLPDKTIETEYLEIKTLRDKYPLFRAPLLRGIAGFIDSLSIGYRALMLSAEKSDEETGEEEMSRFDAWIDRKFGDKAMKAVTVTGTVLGVALAVLLFFVLPTWIYNLIGGAVPFMQENQVLRSLIEGVMRLAIFIGYVILCSQVEGVGRVFEYHGAEHKTIFCYEKGKPVFLVITVQHNPKAHWINLRPILCRNQMRIFHMRKVSILVKIHLIARKAPFPYRMNLICRKIPDAKCPVIVDSNIIHPRAHQYLPVPSPRLWHNAPLL